MEGMYKRVDAAIERKKAKLAEAGDNESFADIQPTDYLNFYCLANRETREGGQDPEHASGILNQTRRHLVYTHSKMTIVDDSIALIGSANINQRSLDGNRDSELCLGSWQPKYLATKDSVPHGDVHGFRLYCFAHLLGVMEDVFRDPASLACVRRVNEIAEKNWSLYTQPEVCEMTSYLVPFPVMILPGGKLRPRTSDGHFPDTSSNILGTKPILPQYLTT